MAQNPASSPQPTQNVDITEEAMERSSSLFSQVKDVYMKREAYGSPSIFHFEY